MLKLLLVLIILSPHAISQMSNRVVQIPLGRVIFDDNAHYSSKNFDDSNWQLLHWSKVKNTDVWWLRSEFSIPKTLYDPDLPLGLYIHAVASSQVWIDGVLIGNNGIPSSDIESEIPGKLSTVLPIDMRFKDAKKHVLAIRISTQHNSHGVSTPLDSLYISSFGSALDKQKKSYLPTIITAGAIGLASLFLLVMTVYSGSMRSFWLLISSFSALMQMIFEVLRAYVNYPYPWHVWRLMGISIFACITSITIIAYLANRFEFKYGKQTVLTLSLIFIMLQIFIPHSEVVSLISIFCSLLIGIFICAFSYKSRFSIKAITAIALAILFALLLINPGVFIDRYYYFGITALIMMFFIEYVINYSQTTHRLNQVLMQSTRLRLELLKQYLKPHFLLNTLTSLSEWFEVDQKIGHRMIQVLSTELRLLEKFIDEKLIPFQNELHLCQLHLELYGYRQDQQYQLIVENSNLNFYIPPAIIHTLIENALSHNVYDGVLTEFKLLIKQNNERISLELKTPIVYKNNSIKQLTSGAGYRYINARLTESFSEDYSFYSESQGENWYSKIEIPFLLVGDASVSTIESSLIMGSHHLKQRPTKEVE